MKTIVIYHSADFDGIFCREIAKKFIPDAELFGWNFGDATLNIPENKFIYVLDLPVDRVFGFEYKPEDVDGNGPQHPAGLIWIDHHKSSISTHPKSIGGYRIDGVAACRLAWQFFSKYPRWCGCRPELSDFVDRKVDEPYAVRLAGEYDIWDKRDPNAELFQHGLRSQELTERDWTMLLDDLVDGTLTGTGIEVTNSELRCGGLLAAGRAIQYAKNQENESIIKSSGFDIEFEGLKFLACNHARFNSHLFTAGIRPDHDALFGFKWDGKQWNVSLYGITGRPEIDLSIIAVKYGGGGHKGACGFRVKKLPFLV